MARINNLLVNAKWSYIGSFVSIALGFLSRTVFNYILGTTYLGLNSLFMSVLGLLSFAELGIGNVLNTQLYKPVADNDHNKVKAILHLYKKAYTAIALVIAAIGLAILPFLDLFLKGAENVKYIYVYYLVFLFNTVISYFVSYKFSLPNAEQKNYIQTNIITVFSLVSMLAQVIAIIVFREYWVYLVVQTIFVILQCLYSSIYLNNKYPIFAEKKTKLAKKDKDDFTSNLSSGVMYKLSEVLILQTDDVIISGMLNVNVTGVMSNYKVLIGYIEKFTKPVLDNTGPGLGNFIATESIERKRELIRVYQFLGFWVYGFCAIGLVTLSTPLIQLWLGADKILSTLTITIFFFNFFFSGLMRAFASIKIAHGIFYDDWYIGFIGAIVKIALSIYLVTLFGLPGLFIGTLASYIVIEIGRPIISYKKHYDEPLMKYFIRNIKYLIVGLATGILMYLLINLIVYPLTLSSFIIATVAVIFIPNIIWVGVFYRTKEFKYFLNIFKNIIAKIFKKLQK